MDWELAEQRLTIMANAFIRDDLHKLTFDREIFPLVLRYYNGERTDDLYSSIERVEKMLMKDVLVEGPFQESCRGFFMNSKIKPAYEDVLKIIGTEKDNWNKIFDLLRNDLKLKVNFKFHDPTGWVLEFNRSGKVLIILIPDKNDFKVNIPTFGCICQEVKKTDNITGLYTLIDNYVKTIPFI